MAYYVISTSLRTMRENQGWSLEKLAHKSNLSIATIKRIEGKSGLRKVSSNTIECLARAFDLQVKQLQKLLFFYDDPYIAISKIAIRREQTLEGRNTYRLRAIEPQTVEEGDIVVDLPEGALYCLPRANYAIQKELRAKAGLDK